MSDYAESFIRHLETLIERDTRPRAVLRRSLAFEPGGWPEAFPYVEPFIGKDTDWRRRSMTYLVAGLWAMQRRPSGGNGVSLGVAAAWYCEKKKAKSIEKRFIALLAADEGQLPHRLRQMVALLGDYPLSFARLLDDICGWEYPDRNVKVQWARDFYSTYGNKNKEGGDEREDID